MDKATSNHAFCSTDTPTSVSLSCAFVLFVVKYSLRLFVPIRAHSCAFVVQTIPCHRHFVPFVYFVLFVVHPLLNGRVAELPRGRAHARHPRTAFSSLFPMKNYSCPLVSIRGSYSFRHFVPFVYFVLFVVKYSLRPFVSIRVHSWFISFRPFVVHILSIPSCPFVASKDHSAIKNRPGIPERLSKRFTFLPATRRHRSRMGLPGRPR